MANFELTLNPHKFLKRKDLVAMTEMMKKAFKDKRVDTFILKLTDDRKAGENAMMFPFKIVE